MKNTEMIKAVLNAFVIIIGAYMIVEFAGVAVPPLLSGIAFVLIGIAQFLEM